MLSCVTSPAFAQNQNKTTDVYELVLQVGRNGEALSNSILGLQKGFTGYYLPAGELAALIGIKVNIDLETGRAEGWYIKEGNTYTIDTKSGTYSLKGEVFELPAQDFIVKNYGAGFGDIYISVETLNKIWPLELEIDFSKLRLLILSPRKLPYELKRDREKKRNKRLSRDNNNNIDTTGFHIVNNPYKMYTPPVVDIRSVAGWDNTEKRVTLNNNLSGKNDLLGFSADYNLNLDYENSDIIWPDVLRMSLTKRAFGEETMPLGVRELRIGDVGARTSDLINGSNAGRGVSISSRPLHRKGTFDEITVEGVSAPGWEVELYRGGELLDFTLVNEAGQYKFDDVTLLTGENIIRTVLYGPEGQIEERIEKHSVGGSALPSWKIEYEATVVDTKNNFIEFDDVGNRSRGTDEGGLAYSGSMRLGVNRWMSLFATGAQSRIFTGEKKYATVGADLTLGRIRANVEAYREVGGGKAIDTRVATRLKGWRVNLKTQFLNDFESDRAGFGDRAKTFDASANLSKRFTTKLGTMGLTVSGSHKKRKGGTSTSRVRLSKFLSINKQRYGNSLSANYTDHALSAVDGQANASFRLSRKLRSRMILSYKVRPSFYFNSGSLDIDYKHSKKLRGSVGLGQTLQTSNTTANTNISYDFGKFLGSVSSNWSQNGGVSVLLRASTSLAPFGEDGSYIMSSRSLKNQNALNSHVYLDRNLNNLYDSGDDPLEDVMLLFNGREAEKTSTETGFYRKIQGINGDYAALTLDDKSVNNPFHASSRPGFNVLLRPGVTQDINFPLVETGVIDGTAYFDDGRPVPGLRLQLVNGEGDIVKETLTSFDGFYTFEFVRPGGYVIRSDPARNLNMPPRLTTVSPDALFAYGVNVKLLEKGGLAPSAIDIDKNMVEKNQYPILGALVRLQSTLRNAVSGS